MKKNTVVILLYATSIICIFLSLLTDGIFENFILTSFSIFLSLFVFKLLKKEGFFMRR